MVLFAPSFSSDERVTQAKVVLDTAPLERQYVITQGLRTGALPFFDAGLRTRARQAVKVHKSMITDSGCALHLALEILKTEAKRHSGSSAPSMFFPQHSRTRVHQRTGNGSTTCKKTNSCQTLCAKTHYQVIGCRSAASDLVQDLRGAAKAHSPLHGY